MKSKLMIASLLLAGACAANLNAQENDVLDDCFHVLPEETRKRKQEVDDFFHSLL